MHYYAHVRKSEGVYLVSFPDVPSVNTYGETVEEALRNASEALNGALEADFERGYKLPEAHEHKGRAYHPVEVAPHLDVAYTLRRLRNGRSQSAIAKKLGITYQAYQRLENPRQCNPRLKTLEKIGEVMGKRVEVAFT
jgi:antitoxin HicB